jgi:hypothetical protein
VYPRPRSTSQIVDLPAPELPVIHTNGTRQC